MRNLILSLALLLGAFTARGAQYSIIDLVPLYSGPVTNSGTPIYATNLNGFISTNTPTSIFQAPTVLTNTQTGVVGKIAVSPGDTIGIVAAYRGSNGVSGTASFYLRDNYDTNYPSLWRTNLSFTLAASGTNLVVTPTNASVADRGFVQLVVSNGIGSTMSNLVFRIFNLTPNITTP